MDLTGRYARYAPLYPDTGESAPPQGTAETAAPADKASPTFDDLLKDKTTQQEFDRRVTKALETARQKWEQETASKVSEAEKLALMTAEQKAQHEREKREADIAKREAAIALKELRATAAETLAAKGLPSALLGSLSYADATACNASISAVETAFRAAVQAEVEERMKGKPPAKGGATAAVDYDKEIQAAKDAGNLVQVAYLTRMKAQSQAERGK